MRDQEQNLTVERGLIVSNSAGFTEVPECDLDMYNDPQVQNALHEICASQTLPTSGDRIITRKPDGTLCYLRCR